MAKNPLRITDTILRDAHQSQAATRMRIEDMLPACEKLDNMGYWSLECWGGATFDACMRFLNEDPWERLRTIRQHVKHTKLQMLFRGQNILGYKHYADDVVDAFCRKSIENGIDIIRIFDALNDVRNLEQASSPPGSTVAPQCPAPSGSISVFRNPENQEPAATVTQLPAAYAAYALKTTYQRSYPIHSHGSSGSCQTVQITVTLQLEVQVLIIVVTVDKHPLIRICCRRKEPSLSRNRYLFCHLKHAIQVLISSATSSGSVGSPTSSNTSVR